MNLTNFAIEANYAIRSGKHWFDLHNDYDFSEFKYNPSINCAILCWVKSKLNAKNTQKITKITLNFIKVLVLKTEFGVVSEKCSDANTLAFVGFLHPDDLEVMNGCLTQDESDASYHLIFQFESGLAIKCFSEAVICQLE